MALNKAIENNLFVLTGQEEQNTPYDWKDMPQFEQNDLDPYRTLTVRFRNEEDLKDFAAKIGHLSITPKTK